MSLKSRFSRHIFFLLILASSRLALAQTTLSLDSGSAALGGSVSVNLHMTGAAAPAGLQWTLSYPSADIASVTVAAGYALGAAGKTVTCSAGLALVTCVASGMNATTIGNGSVAVVTMTLASAAVDASIPISVSGLFGVLPDGTETAVSGSGGVISVLTLNPLPVISSLSPSTAVAGGAGFTLVVNGSGFVATSVVQWNGSSRTTTLVSATQLKATVTAADIAAAGTAQVTVVNPAPGGGVSGGAVFTIRAPNPLPALTSMTPSSATAGGAAFTLTVNGSGFVSGSVVNWNGSARTTTFVSATQLQAAIAATDLASPGTAQVTVFTPAPGGGTSGGSGFTINNPSPSLISLSPSTATAGGAAFTLTVNGSGFVSGSVVNWNGSARTTTFVGATQLQAAILASDIASSGTVQVTVFSPAPGGGTSGSSGFTINNPSPSLTSLSPSTAAAGGPPFTLTVNGNGFVSGSVVNWNGSARTTTFVSATKLQAAILSTDITTVGTAQATVANPSAGSTTLAVSSTSTGLAFTITAATPGFTAAYGFTEGAGATTGDASGNGNTGQIRGATWTTSGKYGNALQYDGAASYVDLGNPGSLRSTGSMSWSAWVYLTAFPGVDAEIISRSDGTLGWELKATSADRVTTFAVSVSKNGTGQAKRLSTVQPSLNTWYYVAGVYDASQRTLNIYINGALANGTLQGKVPTSQTLFNANTTIGKNSRGGYFNGVIDELRVYTTKALTAAEIQADMNQPLGATSAALSLTTATRSIAINPEMLASTSDSVLTGLSCLPNRVYAGGQTTCELRLRSSAAPLHVQLQVNGDLKIPAAVLSRPNQSTLRFRASTDPDAREQWAVLTATFGESIVQERILIASAGRPVLRTPKEPAAKTGDLLAFDVSALDTADLPVRLGATGIPEGASFDPGTGRFEWTPSSSQSGMHRVTFSATNSLQQSSVADVTIEVDAGTPLLNAPERFTCSPGSIVTLNGRWLAAQGSIFTDPSGRSVQLGGAQVKVNDERAAIVSSSERRVKFLCPQLPVGTHIAIVVETKSGSSNALAAVVEAATPLILSVDDANTNQGLISFPGTSELVMERNHRIPASPAQPGDQVVIWATGLGVTVPPLSAVAVKLGGVYAQVDSVQSVPGAAGVYTIQVRIPDAAASGSDVPVQLEVAAPDGRWFSSTEATLAIEPVSR
jgi:uncharacterized protein (TIGR03437 family)